MPFQTETFEQCLSRLLKTHYLNYAELSRILGYSSKNTLHRIISGEAKEKSRSAVFNDIITNDSLGFSEEEILQLSDAMEVSRIGAEKFQAMREMKSILKKSPEQSVETFLTDIRTDTRISLNDFLCSFAAFENEILIFNCCWKSVSNCFANLLQLSEKTKISHFASFPDDLAQKVKIIGSLFPMIYHINYSGFGIRELVQNNSVFEIPAYRFILIRYRDDKNLYKSLKITLHCETDGMVMPVDNSLIDYWRTQTEKHSAHISPIKSNWFKTNTMKDYLRFMDNYLKIERNKVIYIFKSDFCLNYISEPILKKAFFDSAVMGEMKDVMDINLTKKLCDVHAKRHFNMFNKKKVTQHICTKKGLQHFANTGILTDQFFMIRPFTVDERIEILSNILTNVENNPHFNMHLLNDEEEYIDMEALYCEGHGVEFMSLSTVYDFSNGHTEVIIKQNDFVDLFKSYFTNELLLKNTLHMSETSTLLKQLIRELEQSKE